MKYLVLPMVINGQFVGWHFRQFPPYGPCQFVPVTKWTHDQVKSDRPLQERCYNPFETPRWVTEGLRNLDA
jgi:hypothetical protein